MLSTSVCVELLGGGGGGGEGGHAVQTMDYKYMYSDDLKLA